MDKTALYWTDGTGDFGRCAEAGLPLYVEYLKPLYTAPVVHSSFHTTKVLDELANHREESMLRRSDWYESRWIFVSRPRPVVLGATSVGIY